MASIRKRKTGTVYFARWRDADGNQVEESTNEHQPERAQKKAVQLEAVAKFWEDVPNFQTFAAMNYSPRYCHESFIAAKHLRFDKFCALLQEAGVQFVPAGSWRDTKKKTSSRARRYKYAGQLLTPAQIIERTGAAVSASTLRDRLSKGWTVAEAIETEPTPPAVSGGMARRRK